MAHAARADRTARASWALGWRWLGMVLLVLLALGTGAARAAVPMQTINNPAGPITQIFLGNELSAQVNHTLDPGAFQIYPPSTKPADYGTLVVVDGVLYTPAFGSHGDTATGNLGARTDFTPVSQTPPSGSGTLADPYQVVTQVQAGSSGIAIRQTDSYVSSQDTFRTDMTFSNSGTSDKTLVVYRAMDCYLGGSDSGFGAASGGAVSCTKNANNSPPGRVLSLIPLSAGSHYAQNTYSALWGQISTHAPFADTCTQCTTSKDNGIGLSWSIVVPAGGSVTLSHLTLFSPQGTLPLTTAKTVAPSTVAAGDTVTYTITVNNANTGAVTVDTLLDTLPAGFAYVPGSTTGAVSADPTVAGQTLSWGGISVPGNGASVTVSFRARVGAAVAPGIYYNRVQGTATGYTVQDTGNTAPVTVTAAPPPAATTLVASQTVTPASAAPGSTVEYTITVNNPGPGAVTLNTLSDQLPVGFSYVPGSSSGATTTDPVSAGQTLTWNNLTVPPNGVLTLRFRAVVGPNVTAGTYTVGVQGSATGHTVQGNPQTAPVQVAAGPAPAPGAGGVHPVPTLSPAALALLAAGLGGLAARRRRVRR